jgi:hypothetical protein
MTVALYFFRSTARLNTELYIRNATSHDIRLHISAQYAQFGLEDVLKFRADLL